MKILTEIGKAARQMIVGEDMEKARKGLYVYRDVLNGQEWHDWAVKYGVPSPLAADDFHVTQLYSTVNVQMIPDKRVLSYSIGPGYGDAACFAQLGPDGQSLVVCFRAWELYDRHWTFIQNGAEEKWPTYRPHMTITNETGDFQLSDAALADAPLYINLGPEKYDELKDFKVVADDGAEVPAADDGELVVIISIAASAAQTFAEKRLVDSSIRLNPMDAYALDDIAKGRKITKGVLRRVAATDWAPDAIKMFAHDAVGSPWTPTIDFEAVKQSREGKVVEVDGKKFVEREMTMTVRPIPDEIRKKLPNKDIDSFKFQEEEKLAWGWASVATVGGADVEDLQGDTITTKAQRQWLHSLFRGKRAGLMEHEGEAISEVVEGIVFDADLQKAIGIDLGMEGVLTCTHYTCEKTWALVKSGKWMHSIAGRVLVEVEE